MTTKTDIEQERYEFTKAAEIEYRNDASFTYRDFDICFRAWKMGKARAALQEQPMATDEWLDRLISLVVSYGDCRYFEVEAGDKRKAVCCTTQAFADIMAHARRRIEKE